MKTAGRKRLSALLSAVICCSVFSAYGSTAFADGELIDTERNIKITAPGWESLGPFNDRRIADKNAVIGSADAMYDENKALLKSMQEVYDYYKDVLGYTDWSFTNKETGETDGTLYAVLLDTPGEAASDDNFVMFGCKGGLYNSSSAAKDVIAHEMMHLVTIKKCNWHPAVLLNALEPNALMEAYSDIIGELADDAADWKMGAALYADSSAGYSRRDMADPSATICPYMVNTYSETEPETLEIAENNLYADYQKLMKDASKIENDTPIGGGFRPSMRASLVVSHAAYLMNKAGISRKDLAKIWFNSLDFYKCNMTQATFCDCRRAVTQSAQHFVENSGFSAEKRAQYMDAVNYGFDSAKIYIYHFGYSLQYGETEIKQDKAQSTSYLSSFLKAEKEKFPSDTYWMSDDQDTVSRTPVAFEKSYECNGISVSALVTDGLGIYDHISEEPYFQCAGFARKLQQDFYGTNKYIRIYDAKNYVPQPGDHLRVQQCSRGMPARSHSVFVTAADADSVTYADCNAGGKMEIKWDQTRTTERDTEGRFCWDEGADLYEFEWVERAIPLGDLNGDAAVTAADINVMQNLLYGIEPENTDFAMLYHVADLNFDSKIDSSDLSMLLRFANSAAPTGLYGYIK